jgi:glycosyltransferase involved in cell wall biosynthesis
MNVLFCQPTLDYSGSEKSLLQVTSRIRGEAINSLELLAGADGPMAGDFARTVDHVHIVDAPKLRKNLSTLPRFLRSFWTVYTRMRELRKARPIALVYVNTIMFPQALVAAVLNRLPFVVHVHEVESKYPWPAYQLYLALATLFARRVIVVCDYILRQPRVVWRSRLRERARVVYNATPPVGAPLERTTNGTVRVVTVAGVSPLKGIGDLLPVAMVLRNMLGERPFQLKVVGRVFDQDLYKGMMKGVEEAGLGDRLEFCGETPDVAPFYKEAHMLLHPARSDVFPMVLIEAASYSLPVVTTDAGGCPEAVIEGETGFVVPIGDAQAMADRVTRVIADTERYKKLSSKAYQHHQSAFTPEHMITAIRAVVLDAALDR